MKDRRAHQKLYRARRSAAFKRAGLRSDGKPLVGRKPCGCLFGSCLKCAKTANNLILKPALVGAMWEDYQLGMSLTAVAEKYGKHRKSLPEVFERRGLKLRPVAHPPRLGFGVKIPDPTAREQQKLIDGLKHLAVPPVMKQVWKRWTMPQRQAFVKKLRVKFPSDMPTGPFSKNVLPFKYGDAHAHELLAKLNAGKSSQNWKARLFPSSEGVIYNGEFYFWVGNTGYCTGIHPRTALHHHLWEAANRRPVPPQMTVIHLDGNKNNFAPKNLGLRSMADCARMNAWHRRPEQFPGIVQRIAAKAWETKNQKRLRHSRATISTLLSGKPNLLNQLQRRKHETAIRP